MTSHPVEDAQMKLRSRMQKLQQSLAFLRFALNYDKIRCPNFALRIGGCCLFCVVFQRDRVMCVTEE